VRAMKPLLTTIVAALVLLHGLFGCCWHPTQHVSSQASTELSVTQPSECRCHAHAPVCELQGHQDEHSPSHPASPSERHTCCHDQCNWISESLATDLERLALSQFQIVPADRIFASSAVQPAAQLVLAHQIEPFALPVRIHLALGVLLI
jgi:hypothetical protein